jgi:hypothetical protein
MHFQVHQILGLLLLKTGLNSFANLQNLKEFQILHEGPHFLPNLKVEKCIIFEGNAKMCRLKKG